MGLTNGTGLKFTREEITETRRKYTKIHRREVFLSEMAKAAKNGGTVKVKSLPKFKKKKEDIQYIFIADLHFDKSSTKAAQNIFKQFDMTKPYVLVFTGDNIAGNLRISDLLSNDFSEIQQTEKLSDIVVKNIAKNPPLEIIILRGNHDEIRVTQGLYGEYNPSFSDVLGTYIQAKTEGKVKVSVLDEWDFQLGKQKYKVIHGHQFRTLKKLREYYKGKPFNTINGHFHEYNATLTSVSLPPACEHNAYAKSLGHQDQGRFITVLTSDGFILKEI